MDPLTLLLRLPFMPIQGVIRLGGVLQDQAERELHNPAAVRRQLEKAQEAHVSGEMSDTDLAKVEEQAIGRLVPPTANPSARTRAGGEGS